MESDSKFSRGQALSLSFVAIIWASPFAWLFTNAFDTQASGRLEWPNSPGFANFATAMGDNSLNQLFNSLWMALGCALLTVSVAIFAAYPLSRLRIPGRNAFLWSLVLLRMMPSAGVLVPVYYLAQDLGMLSLFGVTFAISILNLPFALLLLKNFFDTVPIDLEEAAYVEGASLMQIIRRIVLPLSKGGITVVFFFSFTAAWNEFLFPLIFARTATGFPMSVGLYAAFGQYGAVNYGFLAAYSLIYAAPAVAVYFLLRRNLNTGFAGVGVKG
jgi:multiple sugar transport system permease protein